MKLPAVPLKRDLRLRRTSPLRSNKLQGIPAKANNERSSPNQLEESDKGFKYSQLNLSLHSRINPLSGLFAE